jgi:hypothetical protein
VAYLTAQAIENPGPFMALLGKVLPMQVTGGGEGEPPVNIVVPFVKPGEIAPEQPEGLR